MNISKIRNLEIARHCFEKIGSEIKKQGTNRNLSDIEKFYIQREAATLIIAMTESLTITCSENLSTEINNQIVTKKQKNPNQ